MAQDKTAFIRAGIRNRLAGNIHFHLQGIKNLKHRVEELYKEELRTIQPHEFDTQAREYYMSQLKLVIRDLDLALYNLNLVDASFYIYLSSKLSQTPTAIRKRAKARAKI